MSCCAMIFANLKFIEDGGEPSGFKFFASHCIDFAKSISASWEALFRARANQPEVHEHSR